MATLDGASCRNPMGEKTREELLIHERSKGKSLRQQVEKDGGSMTAFVMGSLADADRLRIVSD